MIYYIYKINFLCGEPKGRYYLGKHIHNPKYGKDTYAGSGKFCRAYFKKYGKIEGVTYTKEVICYCSSEKELSEKEREIIGNLYETDPLCMNLKCGGEGGAIPYFSEEHRRKLSEKGKRPCKEETKIKIGKANTGKKRTDEYKKQMSIIKKKEMINPEARKKYSEANKGQKAWNKGIPMTEEAKQKSKESHKGQKPWNKGIPMTEEQKQRVRERTREAMQNPEARKKCSEAKKGKPSPRKGIPMTEEAKQKLRKSISGKHRVYHEDGTYHYE